MAVPAIRDDEAIMARVLMVDNSEVVLKIAEDLLLETGNEVLAYTSSRQALQQLKTQSFDLIVTDIYMPDADGLEVIREAKQFSPQTPIIAMSGMTGRMNMLKVAQHLGACCTLLKPFTRTEFLSAVSTALESGKTAAGNCQESVSQPEKCPPAGSPSPAQKIVSNGAVR
jgi:CheY-like chemotaxis protein